MTLWGLLGGVVKQMRLSDNTGGCICLFLLRKYPCFQPDDSRFVPSDNKINLHILVRLDGTNTKKNTCLIDKFQYSISLFSKKEPACIFKGKIYTPYSLQRERGGARVG